MGKSKNKYQEIQGLSLQEKIKVQRESGKTFYVPAAQLDSTSIKHPSRTTLETGKRKTKKNRKNRTTAAGSKSDTADKPEKSSKKKHKRKLSDEGQESSLASSLHHSKAENEELERDISVPETKRKKRRKTVPVLKEKEEGLALGVGEEYSVEEKQDLRSRLTEKLKGSRFRYLNEQLYTSDGEKARKMFEEDPSAFQVYHEGFLNQIRKWPINPLDLIISRIAKLPCEDVVADMGCGEARLASSVKQKVHSFDLSPINKRVTVSEMSKVPLESESVEHCVFCLSLMGTNLTDYLREANRILKVHGCLHIAEIRSRIGSPRDFQRGLEKLGFKLTKKRDPNDYFTMFEFQKVAKPSNKRPPGLKLKPCLYKKR